MKQLNVVMALGIVIVMLLSGCGGKPKQDVGETTPTPTYGPNTGAIVGTIIDNTDGLVTGANVTLKEVGKITLSDSKGYFTFNELSPGPYNIDASKEEVGAGSSAAVVKAGEISNALIILLPTNLPRSELKILDGKISCGTGGPVVSQVACGDIVGSNKFMHQYTIPSNASGALFEVAWTPVSTSVGGKFWYSLEKNGCGFDCHDADTYAERHGASALSVRWSGDQMHYGTIQSRTFPNGGGLDPEVNVFYDQSFKIYFELFYGKLPENFESKTNVQ